MSADTSTSASSEGQRVRPVAEFNGLALFAARERQAVHGQIVDVILNAFLRPYPGLAIELRGVGVFTIVIS